MIYYGKTYDYRNKEEAKALIGKSVVASDWLSTVEKEKARIVHTLKRVSIDDALPFIVENSNAYQFIREVTVDDEVQKNDSGRI